MKRIEQALRVHGKKDWENLVIGEAVNSRQVDSRQPADMLLQLLLLNTDNERSMIFMNFLQVYSPFLPNFQQPFFGLELSEFF